MERFKKLGIIMIFIGGCAVLVAGTIIDNNPMIIGGTIGLVAGSLIAFGAVFATRTPTTILTTKISVNNPLSSNV